ncbi:MAG: MOSC domain-containing protein [Opitutaceae bacterium]|nr:MOSC domain-containing protein [Opitutaceae bacterium]
MPSVASLHIHPIKSCRGHDVSEAALDRFGLAGDRRFLVVDERGQFLTQRTLPRLALVEPTCAAGTITLAAPGMPVIEVNATPSPDTPRLDVVIWRDTVVAADLGSAVAAWLGAWLGRPARLVAMPPEFSRPIRKATGRPGDESAFSDAYPLLVLSEASLAELNGRLEEPLPMDRFRPNLVVRDCAAFAEDTWRRIRIGDVVLRAAGACARCIVTTTDQHTLERGKEPLRTLAQYRRSKDGDVNFGQNYIHEIKGGVLRVGLPVEVLE